MIARRYQGRQSSKRAEAILARYPDLESGNFYDMVKPDELVKVTLRRIARLLVSLSFCLMIGLGLLMAHGIAPGSPVQERLDLWGWIDYSGNSVANVFFTLAR